MMAAIHAGGPVGDAGNGRQIYRAACGEVRRRGEVGGAAEPAIVAGVIRRDQPINAPRPLFQKRVRNS
ncbi:MAG: hypothetical protein ACYSUD_20365 [Planctomycetota bacterium]